MSCKKWTAIFKKSLFETKRMFRMRKGSSDVNRSFFGVYQRMPLLLSEQSLARVNKASPEEPRGQNAPSTSRAFSAAAHFRTIPRHVVTFQNTWPCLFWSGGLEKKFSKNDQKPSKSLKIATLAVRDYARSNRNEKLTLDKSSKYYFDSKNTIL